MQTEFPNSSLISLLDLKDTICGQTHDVAGYKSSLPYQLHFFVIVQIQNMTTLVFICHLPELNQN